MVINKNHTYVTPGARTTVTHMWRDSERVNQNQSKYIYQMYIYLIYIYKYIIIYFINICFDYRT